MKHVCSDKASTVVGSMTGMTANQREAKIHCDTLYHVATVLLSYQQHSVLQCEERSAHAQRTGECSCGWLRGS